MSWHVEAKGNKIKVLDFCRKQKYFQENAPIGVQEALRILADYFPTNSIISITCNGHIDSAGGNLKIEISNLSSWVGE